MREIGGWGGHMSGVEEEGLSGCQRSSRGVGGDVAAAEFCRSQARTAFPRAVHTKSAADALAVTQARAPPKAPPLLVRSLLLLFDHPCPLPAPLPPPLTGWSGAQHGAAHPVQPCGSGRIRISVQAHPRSQPVGGCRTDWKVKQGQWARCGLIVFSYGGWRVLVPDGMKASTRTPISTSAPHHAPLN